MRMRTQLQAARGSSHRARLLQVRYNFSHLPIPIPCPLHHTHFDSTPPHITRQLKVPLLQPYSLKSTSFQYAPLGRYRQP